MAQENSTCLTSDLSQWIENFWLHFRNNLLAKHPSPSSPPFLLSVVMTRAIMGLLFIHPSVCCALPHRWLITPTGNTWRQCSQVIKPGCSWLLPSGTLLLLLLSPLPHRQLFDLIMFISFFVFSPHNTPHTHIFHWCTLHWWLYSTSFVCPVLCISYLVVVIESGAGGPE